MRLSDRIAAAQRDAAVAVDARARVAHALGMPEPTPDLAPEPVDPPPVAPTVFEATPLTTDGSIDGQTALITSATADYVTIVDHPVTKPAARRGGRHSLASREADTGAAREAERPVLRVVDGEPDVAAERVRYVDPLAGIKRTVHQSLLEALGPTLYDAALDEKELAAKVRQTLQQVIESEEALLTAADRSRITDEVSDEILGHGPIEPFLRDPGVSEIMVNGAQQIYVERDGRIHQVPAAFSDDLHLRRTIEKIVGRVGRRIDEASPMVDARLPDGSRVNAVIPPVSLDGPTLTIRKFAADPLQVDDMVDFGTMSAATAALLDACVRGRLNVLISGGTGSGKTTTLNVLSSFVPSDERIVTIEDAAELQLRQDHVVRMETRPPNVEGRGQITARDLVRNALRMRPDRIIVGEVRDGAAVDMLQAMNTGHDGSLTTLHANSPRDALARLETMVLMAGVELPTRAIREQAASAIDVIVHQSRLRDGTRRITHVTEVAGMEGEVITLQDIFVFDHGAGVDQHGRFLGSLQPTGVRPQFVQQLADQGIALPLGMFSEAI